MFRIANDFRSIEQIIQEVQKSHPDFTRARLRGWIQRNGFPKAAIVGSTGAGPVEGYYPRQAVDFILKILEFQAQGLKLADAFNALDKQIEREIEDLKIRNPLSPAFCHFAQSHDVFLPTEITIVELLAEFRDTHFETSDSVDELSPDQKRAISNFVDDVRQELEAYFLLYNKVKAQKSEGLFSSFRRIAYYHDFVRVWVLSRESPDLTKLFFSWDLGGMPSPIDLYYEYQDRQEEDWR